MNTDFLVVRAMDTINRVCKMSFFPSPFIYLLLCFCSDQKQNKGIRLSQPGVNARLKGQILYFSIFLFGKVRISASKVSFSTRGQVRAILGNSDVHQFEVGNISGIQLEAHNDPGAPPALYVLFALEALKRKQSRICTYAGSCLC